MWGSPAWSWGSWCSSGHVWPCPTTRARSVDPPGSRWHRCRAGCDRPCRLVSCLDLCTGTRSWCCAEGRRFLRGNGWSLRAYCYTQPQDERSAWLPMFQVPTNTVIMSGSGFCECLFFICWSSWQKPSLFCPDIKEKIAHSDPQPGDPKIFQSVSMEGNLLVCLSPWCSRTQTLYAGSSPSPSPRWVWCVLSEISPAVELKKQHQIIKIEVKFE